MDILAQNKSGIYKIANTVNGKFYIGSSVSVRKRLFAHFKELRRNIHHGKYIQHAYNKYGEEAFVCSVVLHCEKWELYRYEQALIDTLKPQYNMSPTAGTCLGTKHTEESRRNMSIAHQGQVVTPEARAKMSKTRRGMKQTPEWVAKRALAHIGKKISDESKAKMSAAKIGKMLPPEHKQNLQSSLRRFWDKKRVTTYKTQDGQVIKEGDRIKRTYCHRGFNGKMHTLTRYGKFVELVKHTKDRPQLAMVKFDKNKTPTRTPVNEIALEENGTNYSS